MSSRRIFLNDSGLRAGWRLLAWLAIVTGIEYALYYGVSVPIHAESHPFLDPMWDVIGGVQSVIAVLVATLVMARIEHRTFHDYYIRTRDFLGRQFWHGLLWGFLAVSLLIGLIAALYGYRITGLAIHGRPLVYATFWWLMDALAIGVSEELQFRAYLLRTLADGIRFWPAAIVLSAGFGALHYFLKPYERWEDFACTGLLGLFLCLTIRRTGSLAFAIGFHASFDWAAIFLYSGRNAGEFAVGHLLQTSWTGPDWLTGGMLGPEASRFVFIVIALLFILFPRLYPTQLSNNPNNS